MNANFFTKFFRLAFAGLLILSLAGIASCEKTEEPAPTPEPIPAKYTIKGQVFNQATNTALSGVLVTMSQVASGPSLTQTTDATGNFSFANLATAGKYTLVLTKADFYSTTISIDFVAAGPNHTIVFTLTATLAPIPPVIPTPGINPVVGGVVTLTGGLPATLTVPAGTIVKDASGAIVTGNVNILAYRSPDIVIAGVTNNLGIFVFRVEPNGYQFDKNLPLVFDNPLTGYRYNQLQLEYFNIVTNRWEVQTQPVNYDAPNNHYMSYLTHFSLYKVSFQTPVAQTAAVNQPLTVTDNLIYNTTLVPKPVSTIRYIRKAGYVFETPILTTLSAVGITGADATTLADQITEIIKQYNNGVSAVSQFTSVSDQQAVNRTILPDYKLVVTGTQLFITKQFTIQLVKLSTNTLLTVVVKTNAADIVTLIFEDKFYDYSHEHDHALGGGGTN